MSRPPQPRRAPQRSVAANVVAVVVAVAAVVVGSGSSVVGISEAFISASFPARRSRPPTFGSTRSEPPSRAASVRAPQSGRRRAPAKTRLYSANTAQSKPGSRRQRQKDKPSAPSADAPDTRAEDEAALSDVDARVLQAMLAEDKLNVNEERNLKDLLDRGIRSRQKIRREQNDAAPDETTDNPESRFSSSLFKTLSDTRLWKVVQRNAQDIVESARIYVSNRVERDSQLLGALGLFAFDRAVRDVKRALPAAAKATQRAVGLRLGNTSSYSNTSNTTGAMVLLGKLAGGNDDGGSAPKDDRQLIVEDMTTAADEIKAVSESVREIFRSGGAIGGRIGTSGTNFASPLDRRALRSAVDKSTSTSKQRFARAYERAKATKLKQEKENVAQKAVRATGTVVDSAYELRREIQSEVNEPGYRSKQLRETAAATSRQLQAGAQRLLQAVKRDKAPALEASQSKPAFVLDGSTPTPTVERDFRPATDAKTTSTERVSVTPASHSNSTDAVPNASFALNVTVDVDKELALLQSSCEDEVQRLLARLTACTASPDTTWLSPSLLENSTSLKHVNVSAVENIVASLVACQRTIELDKQIIADSTSGTSTKVGTVEQWLDTVKEAKELVDDVIQTAAEYGAKEIVEYLTADLLRATSNGTVDDTTTPFLLQLDAVQQDFDSYATLQAQVDSVSGTAAVSPTASAATVSSGISQNIVEDIETETLEDIITTPVQKVVADIVEVVSEDFEEGPKSATAQVKVTASTSSTSPSKVFATEVEFIVKTKPNGGRTVKDDTDLSAESSVPTTSSSPSVSVEVISDDEYEKAAAEKLKAAKKVDSNRNEGPADGADVDSEQEPNLIVQVTLRSIDITFFLLEKTFTVVLPQLFTATGRASNRIALAQKDGMGSKGWEELKSAQKGSKRY